MSMEVFDFTDFIRQRFDSGLTIFEDQGHPRKKEVLRNNKVPFEETDTPNIIRVTMKGKKVLVLLLPLAEDPTGDLVKIRHSENDQWEECKLSFLMSLYNSYLHQPLDNVGEWLKSNGVDYEEVPGLNVVIVRTELQGIKYFVNKKTKDNGLLIVQYELGGKEYTFMKNTLLEKIRSKDPIYRNFKKRRKTPA